MSWISRCGCDVTRLQSLGTERRALPMPIDAASQGATTRQHAVDTIKSCRRVGNEVLITDFVMDGNPRREIAQILEAIASYFPAQK
jgi:hypothetical protein